MAVDETQPGSEREQTDESLRIERQKADQALGEELEAIDETADAVIGRARARADDVLAAARAKTDRELAARTAGAATPEIVKRERVRADRILEEERADADETLDEERADQAAVLSREREDTDSDLATERARADHSLATRDQFLGIVSHELRNMLNVIAGSADLITNGVGREDYAEPVRTGAQRIQRAAARMTRLVGDLIDVASIEAGRLAVSRERGNPTAVVTEAVETFMPQAAAKGISLITENTSPSSSLAFDPARILQVLTNLLSNAIKFTPAGGTVVVRVERVGGELRFAISDSGPGVPPDQLEAVFERFVQLAKNDRRGVGLGLYISKAIVEGHGGRIWAENKSGGGTSVAFSLPID